LFRTAECAKVIIFRDGEKIGIFDLISHVFARENARYSPVKKTGKMLFLQSFRPFGFMPSQVPVSIYYSISAPYRKIRADVQSKLTA